MLFHRQAVSQLNCLHQIKSLPLDHTPYWGFLLELNWQGFCLTKPRSRPSGAHTNLRIKDVGTVYLFTSHYGPRKLPKSQPSCLCYSPQRRGKAEGQNSMSSLSGISYPCGFSINIKLEYAFFSHTEDMHLSHCL